MSSIAIKVSGLSKQYWIGKRQPRDETLREAILRKAKTPLNWFRKKGGENQNGNCLWALKDVSFEVEQGEVVGIIGSNGAGKSTLLKILSRITDPTEGSAEIQGRVASVLGVGTGFHAELTGRENIYLNGTILGMKKREIDHKLDQIVSFAEIERFLDTPAKYYSSGMYVRLSFAVAAHLEPEILLVDEVLAVGDMAFQKKCLVKMGEVTQRGCTILFVSHNLLAIKNMTERCLLLREGRLVGEGDTLSIVGHYLREDIKNLSNYIDVSRWPRASEELGMDLKINRVYLRSSNGQAIVWSGSPLTVEMEIEVTRRVEQVVYGFAVFSAEGTRLFQCGNVEQGDVWPQLDPGKYRLRGMVDRVPLSADLYRLGVGIRCEKKDLDWLRDFTWFEVQESRGLESTWFHRQKVVFHQPSRWEAPERI